MLQIFPTYCLVKPLSLECFRERPSLTDVVSMLCSSVLYSPRGYVRNGLGSQKWLEWWELSLCSLWDTVMERRKFCRKKHFYYFKREVRVYKTHILGYSIALMLQLSLAGSKLRTEQSETADRSVLRLQWAESWRLSVTCSSLSSLQCSLGCGGDGSGWHRLSEVYWEAKPAASQASGRIPTLARCRLNLGHRSAELNACTFVTPRRRRTKKICFNKIWAFFFFLL